MSSFLFWPLEQFHAMLRRTQWMRPRALNAFGAFLKANKDKFPRDFKARSAAVAKAWKAVTPADRERYARIGRRTTFTPRRLSAFGAFLRATKGKFPRAFKARSAALGKAWRALPQSEKAKYAAMGRKVIVRRRARRARRANAFAKFVKQHYASVQGPPQTRLKALARRWKAAQRPQTAGDAAKAAPPKAAPPARRPPATKPVPKPTHAVASAAVKSAANDAPLRPPAAAKLGVKCAPKEASVVRPVATKPKKPTAAPAKSVAVVSSAPKKKAPKKAPVAKPAPIPSNSPVAGLLALAMRLSRGAP